MTLRHLVNFIILDIDTQRQRRFSAFSTSRCYVLRGPLLRSEDLSRERGIHAQIDLSSLFILYGLSA